MIMLLSLCDRATTDDHPLPLHAALPIWNTARPMTLSTGRVPQIWLSRLLLRLSPIMNNWSAAMRCGSISYAVFCLKKKKKRNEIHVDVAVIGDEDAV